MNERTQAIWDWFNGAPFRILVIFIVALIGQVIGNRAIARGIGKLAGSARAAAVRGGRPVP